MSRFVLTAVSLFALILLSLSALAYDGQYRGPVDELSKGKARRISARRTSTNPGGQKEQPGGEGPGESGQLPPLTGGSSPSDSDSVFGLNLEGFDRWEFWWEHNRDQFLYTRARENRERSLTGSESSEFFLGKIKIEKAEIDSIDQTTIQKEILPVLKKGTFSKYPEVRAGSLIALGKMGDPSTVSDLSFFLHDPDPTVQRAAILALGLLGNREGLAILKELLEQKARSAEERAYATLALGLTGLREAVPILSRFLEANLTNKNKEIEQLNMTALSAYGLLGDPSLLPFLQEAFLRSRISSDEVNSSLLLALGKLRDYSSVPTLLFAFGSSSLTIRRSAAIAFGEIDFSSRYEKDIERLYKTLEEWEKKGKLEFEAVKELILLIEDFKKKATEEKNRVYNFQKLVIKELSEALKRDGDVQVRNFSAISLGRLGGKDAEKALVAAFNSKAFKTVQAFAALSLGILGNPENAPLLRKKFSLRGEERLRGAVAIALGLLRDEEALPKILEEFKNAGGDPDFRGYCAVALGLLGNLSALPEILGVLQDDISKQDLGRGLATGVGLLGDKNAAEPLLNLLTSNQNAYVKGFSAMSFGLIRDGSSAKLLRETLESPGTEERTKSFTVAALGCLSDKSSAPLLSRIAQDHNYRVWNAYLNKILKIN